MRSSIGDTFSGGIFAITLLTQDLELSRDFYGNKLGLQEVFQDEVSSVYSAGTTVINLLSTAEAEVLLDPLKFEAARVGTNSVYTLKCADVDAVADQLKANGVELLSGPIDRPWGIRTASFQDTSGHIWELANH
jgi:catechol 2,3-dioxygenase-like lactoylglutathione lyase family enzyme